MPAAVLVIEDHHGGQLGTWAGPAAPRVTDRRAVDRKPAVVALEQAQVRHQAVRQPLTVAGGHVRPHVLLFSHARSSWALVANPVAHAAIMP